MAHGDYLSEDKKRILNAIMEMAQHVTLHRAISAALERVTAGRMEAGTIECVAKEIITECLEQRRAENDKVLILQEFNRRLAEQLEQSKTSEAALEAEYKSLVDQLGRTTKSLTGMVESYETLVEHSPLRNNEVAIGVVSGTFLREVMGARAIIADAATKEA
jgi:hypothetical protein